MTELPHFDIVCIGDYFFDLIYTGLPEFPVLGREIHSQDVTSTGGAMFITTTSLRRLGVRVGWPAIFGNDSYSHFVKELAQQEGIDLSLVKEIPCPYRRITTSLPLNGERAYVTYVDQEPEERDTHRLASLGRCTFDHLHIGGLQTIEQIPDLLKIAKARGATTSTDCQDVPHLYRSHCEWREIFHYVDIFMPNMREAMMVTHQENAIDAVQHLLEWVKIVVVKDGANGAWVGFDGQVIHAPAFRTGSVVDTTGAGDCFNAGFLYGYLIEKAPLERCLRYGNICGGLSVTGVGGATHAPSQQQLLTHLAHYGD
ncbi:MAG: carbohydrate kinase family protein [Chloroflexi bacterium]|nr:carbohydrate kinase family protein [Chloroflexota bacterium]